MSFLNPSQQAIGLAFLRIAPLGISAISWTFSYLTHEYVAAFKQRDVPYDARLATVPGWWIHIRDATVGFRLFSFSSNILLGILNARGSTLFDLLGDGSKSTVPPLAARAYLAGSFFSALYYIITIWWQFVPLQLDVLMVPKLPPAKREAGIDRFIRMDNLRLWTTSFPMLVGFAVATTLWVANLL